ncbi:co-chaperone GroES [Candidatus Dependentiae bacterium]|nr:MAG: co-chaperone GroES [Candidatus Dependentiae bacterium]
MFKKFRPLGDRVLIKRIDDDSKSKGGIIIPEAAKEKTQTGVVVAVGPGRLDAQGKLIPMNVKVDAIVYFGKYSGTEMDDEHLIVREDEILGIIEK